jgi:hypothetical protein
VEKEQYHQNITDLLDSLETESVLNTKTVGIHVFVYSEDGLNLNIQLVVFSVTEKTTIKICLSNTVTEKTR